MDWRGRLSLRAQLALAMALLTLVVAGLLGQMMYRTASLLIRDGAIRSVGGVAESRRASLSQILTDEHGRLGINLEYALGICGGRLDCMRERLEALQAREQAQAATLYRPETTPLVVGQAALLDRVPPRVPGQRAQFFEDSAGSEFYYVTEKSGGWTLTVIYPAEYLATLFRGGMELGRSGESFLADRRGFFLTPPRYASSAGHSHPIDALPMRLCLSGRDGEIVAPDYRGVLVVHGFRYVPEIGGGCIMAHIDAREAFAPVRALGVRALMLTSLLALASMLLALLLARRLTRPIQVRDEALRTVAHDLRNPLNTIALSAGAMKHALPPEFAKTNLIAVIEQAIERASQLIQDLLDVTRTEAGRLPLERSELDATALVHESVDLEQPLAASRSIHLRTDVPADLPALHGDERRLQQVFSNLIANAIQFSPEGAEVVISAQQQDGNVHFAVADNGPGISKEDQQHLFHPFVQAARRRTGGTGLGLSICRGIIKAHGGQIWVHSEVGKGSTFHFTLPAHRSAAIKRG